MTEIPKRLFIAINIPEQIRQDLVSIINLFQHQYLRWIPSKNLHITLHFIGETPNDEIPRVEEKIYEIVSNTPAFTMATDKLQIIRKNRNPLMIWAAMQECESFTRLALQLQSNLPGDSSKKPVPHITLARIKKGKKIPLPDLAEITKTSFEVRSIELMESAPGNSFPVYKVTRSFSLGESGLFAPAD